MLEFYSNFNIENSDVQSEYLYAVANHNPDDKNVLVSFYSDKECFNKLFEKQFDCDHCDDVYDFILQLDYFSKFNKL